MLIDIENLNSGYLTHRILDPQVLTKYLDIIEDVLNIHACQLFILTKKVKLKQINVKL